MAPAQGTGAVQCIARLTLGSGHCGQSALDAVLLLVAVLFNFIVDLVFCLRQAGLRASAGNVTVHVLSRSSPAREPQGFLHFMGVVW